MPTYFSSADFVDSLAGSIHGIFTRPTEFFRQMPKATSYKDSIILLLLLQVLPWMIAILLGGGKFLPSLPTSLGVIIAIAFSLIFSIPFLLLSVWLWAIYLSWAARRFGGGSLSIMDAFQIYAYSSIPSLFSLIPMVGAFIGFWWGIYLEWKGLNTFAGVSGGKALLIIFVPVIVLIISLLILGILVGIYLSQQPPPSGGQMF